MTIAASDLSFLKSLIVADSTENGGRMGTSLVISGAKHSLFPRVTKTQRVSGLSRYRKEFFKNSNITNDSAYDAMIWIEIPSNGGDRFYLKEGTDVDTQLNITSPISGDVNLFTGAGFLSTQLSGGETSVSLLMEANDFVFPNGGFLHLTNKIQVSQTIAVGVVVGDSVNFTTTWQKITSTSDITYPKGLYLGANKVLSVKEDTKEEWLAIAERIYEGESIGTGNNTVSPILSTLTNKTKGICQVKGKLPVITTLTVADAPLVAYLNQDGSVNTGLSDAVSGTLNMATGVWTSPITWDTAPGTGKDITITYRENAYSYVGNTVTILLDDQVSQSYTIGSTTGSGCLYTPEIRASISVPVLNSAGGTYNHGTYPIIPHNIGAERDTITLSFTSSTAYTVSGSNLGVIGTGSTGTSPILKNPTTQQNILTIPNTAWTGSFLSGDTLIFTLYPSSYGFWIKELVPPGTAQENNNLMVMGFYLE